MFETYCYHVMVCDRCLAPADDFTGDGLVTGAAGGGNSPSEAVQEASMGDAIRQAEALGWRIESDKRATCTECLHLEDDDDDQPALPI